MSRRLRGVVALTLLLVVGVSYPVTCAGDDFATWHGLDVRSLDTEHVDLVSAAEFRLYDDSRSLRQVLLQQAVVFDHSDYFQSSVHYTYLPTRVPDTDDWLDQHRLELQATPRWPITDRLRLDFRNRLELRWIEGRSGLNERSRHRLQLTYALKGLGPLDGVYVNNEFFFGYSGVAWKQNRLVPLGLRFRLSDPVRFNLFYLLQSIQASAGWEHSHVLGTRLSVSF